MNDIDDSKLSAFYQRTQSDEPSDFSDALIKKTAHKAIRKQRHNRLVRGWSIAATIVLGVGISAQLFIQAPKFKPSPNDRLEVLDTMEATSAGAPIRSLAVPDQDAIRTDSMPVMRSAPAFDTLIIEAPMMLQEKALKKKAMTAKPDSDCDPENNKDDKDSELSNTCSETEEKILETQQ